MYIFYYINSNWYKVIFFLNIYYYFIIFFLVSKNEDGLSNKKKLYDIKTVDIALAVRSKNPFYNDNKKKTIFALTDSSRDLTRFNDRFLRDTLTVTAYARNVGLEWKIKMKKDLR